VDLRGHLKAGEREGKGKRRERDGIRRQNTPTPLKFLVTALAPDQWRRQDLLRGGAKLEIMSRGAHGELQGRVHQLLDDYSFVTNAILMERFVSC